MIINYKGEHLIMKKVLSLQIVLSVLFVFATKSYSADYDYGVFSACVNGCRGNNAAYSKLSKTEKENADRLIKTCVQGRRHKGDIPCCAFLAAAYKDNLAGQSQGGTGKNYEGLSSGKIKTLAMPPCIMALFSYEDKTRNNRRFLRQAVDVGGTFRLCAVHAAARIQGLYIRTKG